MADRVISVRFSWDKKDQEGQAEQLAVSGAKAKMWITGGAFASRAELTPVTVAVDAAQPNPAVLVGTLSAGANIVANVAYTLEAAAIDDDGTTGAMGSVPYTMLDAGPTALQLSSPSSVPKP